MAIDITTMIGKPMVKKAELGKSRPFTTASPTNVIADKLNEDLVGDTFKYQWVTIGTHLIQNVPRVTNSSDSKVNIAAFDLDDTLINTKSGMKFSRGPNDWKWWRQSVPETLSKLYKQGYLIAIFTNQGAVVTLGGKNSFSNFKQKLEAIQSSLAKRYKVKELYVFASPKKPAKVSISSDKQHKSMRKPEIGMWNALVSILQERGISVDLENSFFVGDAAGRPKDFSDSDLQFAKSANLTFKIPEEMFINENSIEQSETSEQHFVDTIEQSEASEQHFVDTIEQSETSEQHFVDTIEQSETSEQHFVDTIEQSETSEQHFVDTIERQRV
ncbi:pnk1 [Candida oxycetoniae]|uniref:Pnk1 n=1 Tax=Candida oxycetoniae TaxID=497107 RepID=A0AAI9X055_9ASCO|nr:pnk1 [Candida oxycetoniae]KAI3406759.2 pnk1 [Candida oxycetoniae]